MTLEDKVAQKAPPDSGPRKPEPAEKPTAHAPLWQRLRSPFKRRRNLIVAGLVIILALAALVLAPRFLKNPAAGYVTAPVERGSVEDTVTALGNLQPLNYVDVGAQVSGQIQAIHVSIGDKVTKGDLLVEIDPKVQQEKVDQSRSQLASMQANLLDRQAMLKLRQAEAARETQLHNERADSQANYETALAAAASAKAAVTSQEAQIAQAKSSLSADQTTLSYSKILAPMDGTVVSIAAKQGQTINASQQAPTILRIANLSTMTVWTQVSEADVARLKIGMPAYFTTLGDPATRHEGTLRQILPTPEVSNNVVLFDVLFDTPNPHQTLMTQMTAQVFFQVASAEDVLTVPVAALQMGKTLGTSRSGGQGQSTDDQRSAASAAQKETGAATVKTTAAAADATTATVAGAAPTTAGTPAPAGAATRTTTTTTTPYATNPSAQRPNGGWRRGGNGGGSGATDEQRAAWRQTHPGAGNGAGRTTRQSVMVVNGGKLAQRVVEVGVTNRITAEIKSGLKEGEIVVVGKKQTAKASASTTRSALQQGPVGVGLGPRGGGR